MELMVLLNRNNDIQVSGCVVYSWLVCFIAFFSKFITTLNKVRYKKGERACMRYIGTKVSKFRTSIISGVLGILREKILNINH